MIFIKASVSFVLPQNPVLALCLVFVIMGSVRCASLPGASPAAASEAKTDDNADPRLAKTKAVIYLSEKKTVVFRLREF